MEEVESEEALKWVVEQNESAVAALGDPKGTPLYDRVLSILDSKEKIPSCVFSQPPLPCVVCVCKATWEDGVITTPSFPVGIHRQVWTCA